MPKVVYIPKIKAKRKEAGYSQSGLARLIGVHPTIMSRFERGEQYPRYPELKRIADLLKCYIEELYDEVESEG